MHPIDWTLEALADLDRLEGFLFFKSPSVSARAVGSIFAAVDQLSAFPHSGRVAGEFRELLVRFSNGGYVVRYRVEPDAVSIIAVRSQREAGY